MAQLKITFTRNSDRLTGFSTKVDGVAGDQCLLVTAEIARLNKSALLAPTEEMYAEQVEESAAALLA